MEIPGEKKEEEGPILPVKDEISSLPGMNCCHFRISAHFRCLSNANNMIIWKKFRQTPLPFNQGWG